MSPKSKITSKPSPSSPTPTPPTTPIDDSSPFVKMEDLRDLFLEILDAMESSEPSGSATELETGTNENEPGKERVRASKLEFKTVNEKWSEKEYSYRIEESIEVPAVTELDEYVFVVRLRTDRNTKELRAYLDIKSKRLCDELRLALQHIKAAVLEADKPTMDQDLLFNCLPEIESHAKSIAVTGPPNSESSKHLALLIDCLKDVYKETTDHLNSLLAQGMITYNLLWTLFKPSQKICTVCKGTGRPRSLIYDFGKEKKTRQGVKYFELTCRYLDFDGRVFGEVEEGVNIMEFQGAVSISKLAAFPLQYHPTRETIETHLRRCGSRFIEMMASHHCHYNGVAFFEEKDGTIRKVPVNGRVMIDAFMFQKVNPGYRKLQNTTSLLDPFHGTMTDGFTERVKCSGKLPSELNKDDLLVCAPTVLGFSLGYKFWGEFAIDGVGEIEWLEAAFDRLVLPPERKEIVMALAESQMSKKRKSQFDDFITNKDQGLIILASGPPGVGKTLTTEALSEHLQWPLYSVSAGQLSSDAAQLEYQLSQIFMTASHWKALLLLDEADVFLSRRSLEHIARNRLVAMFLHKLEYFEGIMFLTTNQLEGFDSAILNRVHLSLPYDALDFDARREIFRQFWLKEGGQDDVDDEKLFPLASLSLNGRQIKNSMSIACTIAMKDGRLAFSHIRSALEANGHKIAKPGQPPLDKGLYD